MIEYLPPVSSDGKRVLLLDNYDSFTFNIVQALLRLGAAVVVYRHDAVPLELTGRGFTHLVISPGPCRPEDTGLAGELVRRWAGRLPLLGVCLGHQLLATLWNGRVGRVTPVHGKCDTVRHFGRGWHRELPERFPAARYHSLAVLETGAEFEITALNDEGLIMGMRHRRLAALEGVQYHPESFLTPSGEQFFRNFLDAKIEAER